MLKNKIYIPLSMLIQSSLNPITASKIRISVNEKALFHQYVLLVAKQINNSHCTKSGFAMLLCEIIHAAETRRINTSANEFHANDRVIVV
jgi:hypothetical protein